MLRLRQLIIHRFRDVVPGTELHFHDGVNVVLGASGTGKTMLLDLVSMVLRFDFEPLAGQAFHIEFELEYLTPSPPCSIHGQVTGRPYERGSSALRGHTGGRADGYQDARIAITVDGDEPDYVLEQQDGTVRLQYDGQTLGSWRARSSVSWWSWRAAFLVGDRDVSPRSGSHVLPLFLWLAFQHFRAYRFDEGLGGFEDLVADRRRGPARDSRSIILVRNPSPTDAAWIDQAMGFFPLTLWRGTRKLLERSPGATTLSFEHPELPFLDRMVRLSGFEAARMELSLLDRYTSGAGVEETRFGNYQFFFIRRQGTQTLGHDSLSYGQKRLLALLYYLEANPDLIVADELVNGMHQSWLTTIMTEITERQAFLSCANPHLLEHITYGSVAALQDGIILCGSDEHHRTTWRNLGPEQAQAAFDSYDAGAQRIADCLPEMRLW